MLIPGVGTGSRTNRERAIDLFSGSGAVTAGMTHAGFRVIAAVDNDPVACRTYRLNHPSVDLFEEDIQQFDPQRILKRHPDSFGLDLLIVCAPCQPFSSQNRKKASDPRATLLLESVKFVATLKPRCALFENVPGLASPSNLHVLRELQGRLAELGYILGQPRRIDAADLGVPQRRLRCVMVASQSVAAVKAFGEAELAKKRMTVREAIGHLSALKSGEADPTDLLHHARTHRPVALARLASIPKDGGSRLDLPKQLVLSCHRGQKGFPDVYGRMRWDDVAPTLTTGCDDVTRGRFAHPEQNRAITLREAALLQTFPADYGFDGNRRQVASQIGNAVPVAMVEGLVPILRSALRVTNVGRPR